MRRFGLSAKLVVAQLATAVVIVTLALGATHQLLGHLLSEDAQRDDVLDSTQHVALLVTRAAQAAAAGALTHDTADEARTVDQLREATRVAHELEPRDLDENERRALGDVLTSLSASERAAHAVAGERAVDLPRYAAFDAAVDTTQLNLDALEAVVRKRSVVIADDARDRTTAYFALIGLSAVIVAVALGMGLAIRLTRPLTKLRRAALQFKPDDLESRFDVQGESEIGDLAMAFDAMAKRVRADRAVIAEARADLADIFTSVTHALFVVDEHGRIANANAAALTLAGRELAGAPIESVLRDVASEGFTQGDTTLIGRETEIPVRVAISHLQAGKGRVVCVQDRREQLAIEKELRDAQRLEELGRLAAGIAHEINSPLQFIGDSLAFLSEAEPVLREALARHRHVQLAEEVDDVLPEVAPAIARACEGVQRVAQIVRGMKDFAHPDRTTSAATDVNRLVTSALAIARHEYKNVADVTTRLAKMAPVACMAGELGQAVLNLVVNAAHAIADTGHRGSITVATRSNHESVVISVSDTGSGIPESIREKVFEAFFTTKERGRGTGQGLALVRRVAAAHRGDVRFETEMGRGTTFHISIPRHAAAQ